MLYPWVNEHAHIAEINKLIKKKTYQKPAMEQTAKTKKLIRNRLWSKRRRLRIFSRNRLCSKLRPHRTCTSQMV